MKKTSLCLLAATLLMPALLRAEWNLDAGLDLRLRYYATNNLPNSAYGEGASETYGRYRTRVWGSVENDWGKLHIRLGNEFRDYAYPDSKSASKRFPDVLYVDNLYLETKALLGEDVRIRLGRQDISFGKRRIFGEGTPGDGSRSTFFDALRLTWEAGEKQTLDFAAFYLRDEDWLPTAGKTHANGKRPSDYAYNGLGQDEYGAILYWQDRSNASLGYDAYYVAKFEKRDEDSKFRAEGKNATYHTLGARLLPRFSDTLTGEVEAAFQFGSHDHAAALAYAGLTYAPQKGTDFTAAALFLTGDKDGARGKNSWQSVYNRESCIGDVDSAMYAGNDYTNLFYPHLAGNFNLGRAGSLKLQAGPMFAPKKVADHGSNRGLYAAAKWSLNLEKLLQTSYAKGATLSFTGEALRKGNFFNKGSRDTALLSRVELTWKY